MAPKKVSEKSCADISSDKTESSMPNTQAQDTSVSEVEPEEQDASSSGDTMTQRRHNIRLTPSCECSDETDVEATGAVKKGAKKVQFAIANMQTDTPGDDDNSPRLAEASRNKSCHTSPSELHDTDRVSAGIISGQTVAVNNEPFGGITRRSKLKPAGDVSGAQSCHESTPERKPLTQAATLTRSKSAANVQERSVGTNSGPGESASLQTLVSSSHDVVPRASDVLLEPLGNPSQPDFDDAGDMCMTLIALQEYRAQLPIQPSLENRRALAFPQDISSTGSILDGSHRHDISVAHSTNANLISAQLEMPDAPVVLPPPGGDHRLERAQQMSRNGAQLVCPGDRRLTFVVVRSGRWRVELRMTSFPTPVDLLYAVSSPLTNG